MQMKKLLLTGIAALFLATGTVFAGECTSCRTKEDYKLFSCLKHYMRAHQQDPRLRRIWQQGKQSQAQLQQNPDAMSIVLEGRGACGR
jgi:hypothetical protein